MGRFKTRAVVIKSIDIKENDKLIWLFSEKLGKISCVAKGAKRSKSKFLSSTLSFSFGEYVVYKGKSLYNLEECENIDSFQELLGDLDTLTYASYFCELIDISMPDEESNRDLFRQFVTSLYMLKTKAVDREILARTFEIKLLNAAGFALNMDNCCLCRQKITTSNYINLQYLGGVCKDCEKINGIYVSNTAYNIMKYLNKTPIEKIYRISVQSEVKKELNRVLSNLISTNFMRKPKSLDILNYFDGSENHE